MFYNFRSSDKNTKQKQKTLPPPGTTTLTSIVPKLLKTRAEAVCERLHATVAQLIRDALTEKIEFYEEKFRLEEKRAREERAARQAEKATRRTLRKLGDSPLAPAKQSLAPQLLVTESASDETDDNNETTALYELHGKRIVEVITQTHEKRVRVDEAVRAIMKKFPLTHPPRAEILATLERTVVKILAAGEILKETPNPATAPAVLRTADDLTGREIDPNVIQSFGDVDREN